MRRRRLLFAIVLAVPFLTAVFSIALAQQFDTKTFGEMRWRSIGPYRGGRTKSVCGVPSQPNVFYIGVCNGGVWKTTDYGRTWKPIFDDQPTGSIGAVTVAPSDPNIIYVGSGEGLPRPDLSTGDGIYKSTDAGKTWTHLGLRDGQQIPQIVVDPRNPNRLFVAVLGHPYGPNPERGVFRSTDGGQNFQKVLYRDENTGAYDVDLDPSDPNIVYATLWETRQGPWEDGEWNGTNGGIFKSTDGGTTWKPLTNGFPGGVQQAELAVSPSNPKRLYASVTGSGGGGRGGGGGATGISSSTPSTPSGIYRSDDGGETWVRASTDNRPAARIGGGDQSVPAVDPKNPDIVYSASVVTWKSTDGGKTWMALRGAPGGDDYQRIWINPNNPDTMIIVSDQGAIITVNGGETWSSWYNQPTAQMYHVAADNAFPYRLCSGQQESGSACVSSRGNDGQITFREWHPIGAQEYATAAPDPLNPDIVYGGSRNVSRYDRRTGQVQTVGPPGVRTRRTAPLVFSTVDPHILYYAGDTMWKTADGGHTWQQISPNLARKTWEVPASVGKYRDNVQPSQTGVIYTVAPSYIDVNHIWAGTDDGLIQFTVDGGTNWTDVTPPDLKPWAKVATIDAGHFDLLTAYAAINTLRLDDMNPHIYRTHDGGKTWTPITTGIPDGAPVNVVREDPKRKGLLFAGTEREAYVSFDDGDHWQSLRLNMPATSIRDLIVKNDDIAVATHGRGFWILDDITPLRQIDAKVTVADAFLFQPETVIRVRWDMNSDTPLPPDEPAGQNPPEGAIVNYYLKSPASEPITLEILDAAGKSIRHYSSADPVTIPDSASAAVPLYWYRPPRVLSTAAGMHRFFWDMRYQQLPGGGGGRGGGLSMQAIAHDTGTGSSAPWVAPGQYSVKLTVNGKSYTQPITVKMDPRVRLSALEIAQIGSWSKQLYEGVIYAQTALQQLQSMRDQVKALQEKAAGQGALTKALAAFDQKALALQGTVSAGGGRGGRGGAAAPAAGAAAGQRGAAVPDAARGAAGAPTQGAAARGAAAAVGGAPAGRGGGRGGGAPAGPPDTLSAIGPALSAAISPLQAAEATPTAQTVDSINTGLKALAGLKARWSTLRTVDLPALNVQLKQASLPAIEVK
jgi:photosystem II stability/assembly factor-like uncharacterized protein